ncbi:MAG: restriction endonuclease [Coriobacteriia bacterium]|nr:restriction endonuclease [Coriobacteriia bacterium]
MALWLVRAGKYGEREDFAVEKGYAVIGWDELPDLAPLDKREEVEALQAEATPDAGVNAIKNWANQAWRFRSEIQRGDWVALPFKRRSIIAIGEVVGDYEYHPDFPEGAKHVRKVRWFAPDIPRSAFDQDILFSLGAFMTVCRISRNNAEERVRAIATGKPAPMTGGSLGGVELREEDEESAVDLEQYALDQIREHVGRKFRGHDLTRLVGVLLRAQGFQTLESPAGADGGVDILAGRGEMGFEPPRLCVQVKSQDSPVDVAVLRELHGVMRGFGAEQGLLVSWGGFKQSVSRESRQSFFEIRLWDADAIVRGVLEHYDSLSEDLQAELPLKRIWTLVAES